MSVSRRNIFGPSAASQETDYAGRTGPGGSVDDAGPPQHPAASNDPMGETGVDNNTTQARHVGMVQDHLSAAARESGRDYSTSGNETGAGMTIGGSGSLVLGGGDGGHGDHDADTPNQGNPSKAIAGSDSFNTAGGEGDSGDQTGAGKTLG